MSRVKTFDATGIAPNGRLYAGDLNAIQDAKADQANFSQTVDLGTVRIGDSTITVIKFGTAEARITAALRTDGILRGLGGVMFGTFTTTARDAIPLGSRPQYMHIFNTTTNQLEYNAGSDTTPNWQPVTSANDKVPIGVVADWPWAAASIPANYLLCYGQAVSRTTYAALNALASAASYPYGNGDGSTTFNLPDFRGRVSVGKDDMGGTAANRITSGGSGINGASLGAAGGAETVTLASGQIPAHNHGMTGSPSLSGSPALSGTPNLAGSVGFNDPSHHHALAIETGAGGSDRVISLGAGAGSWSYLDGLGVMICANQSTGITVNNGSLSVNIGSLTVNAGSLSVGIGSIGTSNTGGGGAHTNVQPSIVVNRMIRAL